MSEILDEDLIVKPKRIDQHCKNLRFYTLIFTGVMACIYLLIDIMQWGSGRIFLLLGLGTISLQSVYCFFRMPKKTWAAGIRMVLTVLATIYLLKNVFLLF